MAQSPFSGQERDAKSGNDYAVFRYHASTIGRFMTPDPIAGSITNPQSLNRYAYVSNDPINLIDPLGLAFHSGLPICAVYGLDTNTEPPSVVGFFCGDIYGRKRRRRPQPTKKNLGIQGEYLQKGLDLTAEKREAQRQLDCANELVGGLFERHIFPLQPGTQFIGKPTVAVDPNGKITFSAWVNEPLQVVPQQRFGRRPGLEIDSVGGFRRRTFIGGDVDARQFDGDLVSGFNHLFRQVIPEKFTGKAEKPCDLLRAFKK